ncbi:MAG: 50S ribosomal protein L24 [Anaerolineae bacterium]|jgi:large subunit ribosomal protein L24|uniref:50S ribosomal protein L24 n=1 Tax=Candidatus Amarolinea dominans TaxID=3140696 RepID=UPI0031366F80|nr:50S ribosomal protein L24 [Anaerolineae bacterium]MBK9095112.1 50S ribosomal protein L24 [Anaerolineae bacterium]MBK9232553.1 50S ribosomal protein L24 [Anaerolineae bacterium]
MKIRKGDTVEVIRGEHRGARGKVNTVLLGRDKLGHRDPNDVRVVVAGVNLIIKHQRRTGNVRTQVGRIEREAPIHVSNVMLVSPKSNEPVRVGSMVGADGRKVRREAGTDEAID